MPFRKRVWIGFSGSAAATATLLILLALLGDGGSGALVAALPVVLLAAAGGALYVSEGREGVGRWLRSGVSRWRHRWSPAGGQPPVAAIDARHDALAERGAPGPTPEDRGLGDGPSPTGSTAGSERGDPPDAAVVANDALDAILAVLEEQARRTIVTSGEAVGQLRGSASDLEIHAYEIGSGCEEIETAVGAASEGIEKVADATQELDSAIREVAERCGSAVQTTTAAAERARSTRKDVAVLAETAADIDEIVKLISGIAGRTNMLALNATIEAARAGEAGRGFAIVASEVKDLARQTADAARRISERIRSIQQASSTAVGAMADIDQLAQDLQRTIGEVNETLAAQVGTVHGIGERAQAVADDAKRARGSLVGMVSTIAETGSLAEKLGGFSERVHSFITGLQRDLMAVIRGSGAKDRRRYKRMTASMAGEIEVEGRGPMPCTVTSLSLGGAGIDPVDVADQAEVTLRLADLVLPGSLLRRTPAGGVGQVTFGVRFDVLEDDTLSRLAALLSRLEEQDQRAATQAAA